MRKEIIGDCTLYLGDCLEVMDTLDKVDAVVTDPPYGVNLEYEGFSDSREYVETVCVPVIEMCIEKFRRVVFTPGFSNGFLYPQACAIGCWYVPGATSTGKWGFNMANIIFYYGKDPYLVNGLGRRPNGVSMMCQGDKVGHPCPKPLRFMIWLVIRASLEKETILDPFMGSGTTGVACIELGRKFIGIEMEPKYFDIACKRIDRAERQGKLFDGRKYDKDTCPVCDGSKSVKIDSPVGDAHITQPCARCAGVGKLNSQVTFEGF